MSKKNELIVVRSAEEQAGVIMARIKVFVRDGEMWTDSLSVAEVFGKRHDDLLRVIRKIDVENQVVGLRSFAESSYINSQGKEQPYFEMTESGFFALIGRFNNRREAGTSDYSLLKSLKPFHRTDKKV